ncbi:hypothetical protein CPLU01_10096 [Colletotrichum plurivorum]|uniref:SnoaL-like domain-containing protein n=1 Tax=Colletotrichum plurivorum TaxID=2175906 RepID=A0A8H6K791_9PEZI|nr:hypothetical protein CPLU01_10096 [Colletotrichum plurivorum]
MPYDIQTYLLDRANIHDTITKLCHAYDTRSPDLLTSEVYTSEIELDYRAFFGASSPDRARAAEWSRSAIAALDGMSGAQHVLAGIITRLPQPSKGIERPERCAAVANVFASLVREGARGGALMQNGGHYEFELIRLNELEEKGENPWRIRYHKAVPTWENGNWAVFSPPDLPPIYPKAEKTA